MPRREALDFYEIILKPEERYTSMPEIFHWFQAGSDGTAISELSTHNTDPMNVFTDKAIIKKTKIEE